MQEWNIKDDGAMCVMFLNFVVCRGDNNHFSNQVSDNNQLTYIGVKVKGLGG